MTFSELGIIDPILKALDKKGYTQPTPIQEQAIPILLERKDLLGCAQTGTGKTCAFAVPILQHIYNDYDGSKGRKKIRALVVTPTRELALQIEESFREYGAFTWIKQTVIFGGVKQGPQTDKLRRGVDVLVATPGRLLDLIGQGYVSLSDLEYFVLDEADQMLDMGFIHDIRKIIKLLPHDRQSLFFSATMPPDIVSLSRQILGEPESVTIKPEQPTAERVDQAIYYVRKNDKINLLNHLLKSEDADSVLVFSRTKHGANKIVKKLERFGHSAAAIHGNKSQPQRVKALESFKAGRTRVLVATDIAARGIDVSELSFVVNFDLPNVPETYVHRIGRTGRAGASGLAVSFCNEEERAYLKDIQRLIGQQVPVIRDHPYLDDITLPEPPHPDDMPKRGQRQAQAKKRSGGGNRRGGGGNFGNRRGGGGGRNSRPSSGGGGNRGGGGGNRGGGGGNRGGGNSSRGSRD